MFAHRQNRLYCPLGNGILGVVICCAENDAKGAQTEMCRKKRILLIATGGTIASRSTENGLAPQISSEDILASVPEAADICDIDAMQLYNLDSTNMCWRHWISIAECVRSSYDKYDGFVVTHGTDTMSYALAALSYLIQNSPKPVVMTGSQKSIYSRDTDARSNLLDAFTYAADDLACGVHLVFDGKVILGTRARKTRTKSYNAFSSIDHPETAVFCGGRLIHYICEKDGQSTPSFYDRLEPAVFVLKLIPGMDTGIFEYIRTHYRAVVLESFGVGGLPYYESADFDTAIGKLVDAGVTVIMTTQVQHEGSDMTVYQVGHRIKERYELIEAYNMTLEAVVAKMMWILAQTADQQEIRRLFYTPVQRDIL